MGRAATRASRPASARVSSRASTIGDRFGPTLVAWQRAHGRHALPWQQLGVARDSEHEGERGGGSVPYRVWVAEIMLQQTQVAAVIPFYSRFLERFPDVTSLAQASQDEVMRYWSGLGYYSRARNLHAAARRVLCDYGGVFPDDAKALESLPGVGRSTAAAIRVFAFGRRAAILDGNVKRVLARVFAIEGVPSSTATTRRMWGLAEELLPAPDTERGIEHYTQGLMDLGATICTPRKPSCMACPFASDCLAHRQGRVAELPHRAPLKALPHRRVAMLLITRGNQVLLERRPPTGIWGGLWSLPEALRADDPEELTRRVERFGDVMSLQGEPGFTHNFTHFVLHADVVHARLKETSRTAQSMLASPTEPMRWVDEADVFELGLPAPIRTLMRAALMDCSD